MSKVTVVTLWIQAYVPTHWEKATEYAPLSSPRPHSRLFRLFTMFILRFLPFPLPSNYASFWVDGFSYALVASTSKEFQGMAVRSKSR